MVKDRVIEMLFFSSPLPPLSLLFCCCSRGYVIAVYPRVALLNIAERSPPAHAKMVAATQAGCVGRVVGFATRDRVGTCHLVVPDDLSGVFNPRVTYHPQRLDTCLC